MQNGSVTRRNFPSFTCQDGTQWEHLSLAMRTGKKTAFWAQDHKLSNGLSHRLGMLISFRKQYTHRVPSSPQGRTCPRHTLNSASVILVGHTTGRTQTIDCWDSTSRRNSHWHSFCGLLSNPTLSWDAPSISSVHYFSYPFPFPFLPL